MPTEQIRRQAKITPRMDSRDLGPYGHARNNACEFYGTGIADSCQAFRRDAQQSLLATATWLGGWLSVTAGIVSKSLNLS